MALVPRAVYTFGDFEKWWWSDRINGVWTPRELFYDAAAAEAISPEGWGAMVTCSAGAITPALSTKYGFVGMNEGFPVFVGDGMPGGVIVPKEIDYSKSLNAQTFWSNSHGAWWYNGAWWLALSYATGFPTNLFYRQTIFKCTNADGSPPWTIQDLANTPVGLLGGSNQAHAVRWNGTSRYIRVCGSSNGTSWAFYDFDMDTGTWGSAYGAFTTATAARLDELGAVIELASGDLVVFYTRTRNTLGRRVYMRYCSGGTTGSEIALTDSAGSGYRNFANVVLDPDGERLHAMYYKNDSGSGDPYGVYQQVTNGVLGPTYTFPFNTGISDGLQHSIIWPFSASGALYIPFDDFDSESAPKPNARVYRGTPLDDPVFTAEVISQADDDLDGLIPTCTYLVYSGVDGVIQRPPSARLPRYWKARRGR